jgi:predicted O-methyltransferase YrrM
MKLAGRWKGRLTTRQAGGLAVAVALAAVTVAGAVAGQWELAVASLGLLGVLLFVAVVQLRRRQIQVEQSTRALVKAVRDVTQLAADARAAARELRSAAATERKASRERQRELLATIGDVRKELSTSLREVDRHSLWRLREQTREVEALAQLYRDFSPRAPMPPSGPWALNPTDLLELLFRIDRARPHVVLELGSGTSSVWLAYALERYGGRLLTFDHDAAYADRTTTLLRLHDLDGIVEVNHAPLRPLELDGEVFEWYDPEAFTGVKDVDLLVIDGPPGRTGRMARYPALRMLEGALSSSALIALDDVDRPDEEATVRRWIEDTPGLVRSTEILGKQAILAYSRP